MKSKAVALLLMLFIGSGCDSLSDSMKPKPVNVDGLGSLPALADRQLTEAELARVAEAAGEQKRVGEEDARAMAEIYKRQTKYFARASAVGERAERLLDKYDVELYLGLLLQHESLRKQIWETTATQIVASIYGWVSFEDRENGSVGSAGNLAAAYHNAYNKTVAKDDERMRDDDYQRMQADNGAAVVTAFERAAHEFIDGGRNVTNEQKENAERFLQALKIYNNSLPANERVLNNGRLIDFRSNAATRQQRANIARIFSTPTGDAPQATEIDRAIALLNDRMSATFRELRDAAGSQLRPQ